MPSAQSNKKNTDAVYFVYIILAAVIFTAITVVTLYFRIRLTEENSESVSMSVQLEELNEENKRLIAKIGSKFSLEELENSFSEALDVKTQEIEIEVEKEDKAVITGEENNKDIPIGSWISSVSNIFGKEK